MKYIDGENSLLGNPYFSWSLKCEKSWSSLFTKICYFKENIFFLNFEWWENSKCPEMQRKGIILPNRKNGGSMLFTLLVSTELRVYFPKKDTSETLTKSMKEWIIEWIYFPNKIGKDKTLLHCFVQII